MFDTTQVESAVESVLLQGRVSTVNVCRLVEEALGVTEVDRNRIRVAIVGHLTNLARNGKVIRQDSVTHTYWVPITQAVI